MTLSPTMLRTASIVALISILLAPLVLFVSLFAADDPSAFQNPLVWVGLILVWTYPITAGIGGYKALRAYQIGDYDSLFRWTCLAYTSLGPILLFISVGCIIEAVGVVVQA